MLPQSKLKKTAPRQNLGNIAGHLAAQKSTDPLWPQIWVEGAGEQTITARSKRTDASSKVLLYSSWFCPFAQRAWIALEETGCSYLWVEINPYEVDPCKPGGYTKKQLALSKKREMHPRFVATSPRGLVPALFMNDKNKAIQIWESMPLIEFISEQWPTQELMPSLPEARARVRIFIAHCNDYIQRPFYTMLMEQNPVKQRKHMDKMLEGCRTLARAMAKEGDFFLGDQFSLFEVAIAPFWQRYLWVGKALRGLEFPDDADFRRLAVWWRAVVARPSVAATLVCKERLISSYGDYSMNTATSDVAKTIQGRLSPTSLRSVSMRPASSRPRGITVALVALLVGQLLMA